MPELGSVDWPPRPITTERLVLREPEVGDRAAIIELFTSPEVGAYIGGPRPREEFERAVPETPKRRPGLFVVDLGGAMIGIVTLDRRDPDHPVHVRPAASEAELGYMFLPQAWGRGYAAEACAAALEWCARALPGEPVVLTTQTANERSLRLAAKLGFTEVERFEEWGAEQWFGVWSPKAADARGARGAGECRSHRLRRDAVGKRAFALGLFGMPSSTPHASASNRAASRPPGTATRWALATRAMIGSSKPAAISSALPGSATFIARVQCGRRAPGR